MGIIKSKLKKGSFSADFIKKAIFLTLKFPGLIPIRQISTINKYWKAFRNTAYLLPGINVDLFHHQLVIITSQSFKIKHFWWLFHCRDFNMAPTDEFLTNFVIIFDFEVSTNNTSIWGGPCKNLKTWPFFDPVPPTPNHSSSHYSSSHSRGRGYWGGSPHFCGDPLRLKCSMYWPQNRKFFRKKIIFQLLAPSSRLFWVAGANSPNLLPLHYNG